MRDISRRLKNIEKKLRITQQRIVVILTCDYREGIELPEEPSEWLIYPEAVKAAINGTIVLYEDEEILARKEQLNTSKVQGNV